jgi:hypothetical protein
MAYLAITFKDFARTTTTGKRLTGPYPGALPTPSVLPPGPGQSREALRGAFGLLNHEPLRKVEQEWLDRIFVRARCSAAWIGLAAGWASAEETGIHVKTHLQVPCRCRDSVNRTPKNC